MLTLLSTMRWIPVALPICVRASRCSSQHPAITDRNSWAGRVYESMTCNQSWKQSCNLWSFIVGALSCKKLGQTLVLTFVPLRHSLGLEFVVICQVHVSDVSVKLNSYVLRSFKLLTSNLTCFFNSWIIQLWKHASNYVPNIIKFPSQQYFVRVSLLFISAQVELLLDSTVEVPLIQEWNVEVTRWWKRFSWTVWDLLIIICLSDVSGVFRPKM